MKIIIVHGIFVNDPMDSVGKLKPFFDGSIVFDYDWKGPIGAVFTNKKNATKLKNLIDKLRLDGHEQIKVIAHSNGNAITQEAANQGALIDELVAIAPALKVKTRFSANIKKVKVLCTPHDVPTKAAAILDRIPFIELFIPDSWGRMGAKGAYFNSDATGKRLDESVDNYIRPIVKGHSEWHSDKHAQMTVRIAKE